MTKNLNLQRVSFQVPGKVPWNRLAVIREFLGYKQKELAKLLGVSAPTLSAVEAGRDGTLKKSTREFIYEGIKELLEERGFEIEYRDIFPAQYLGQEPDPRFQYKDALRVKLTAFQPKE